MHTTTSVCDLAEKLKPVVKPLRIIVLSLAAGVLGFVYLAVTMHLTGTPETPDEIAGLLTPLAIGLTPLAFVASWILPAFLAKNARRAIANGKGELCANRYQGGPQALLAEMGDDGRLYGVYQTQTIIGAAALEGAAIVSVIAFLFNGNLVPLGLGVALAVAIVVRHYPRASRVAQWIEQQRQLIEDEKLLVR